MRSQRSAVKVTNTKNCDLDRKKQFLSWLSGMKDITYTANNCYDKSSLKNQSKDKLTTIKQHIQDPNLYLWQDFLTIFQLNSDQVDKLSLLLPKGFSFISKENIPQNIKTRLGHDARKMNLKRQYQLKQAQQALKNPIAQKQFDPNKLQCSQPQQTTFYPQPSKNDSSHKKQDKQGKDRDFESQNKVVLNLKKGQKMVDDLSVFAHPIYQKMHNIVVIKRMLHPNNYSKLKEKQIKKQREKQRIRRIKEARKSKLKRMSQRNREERRKRIESKKQQQFQKKDLKQRKNNRTILLSKKSSKNKISLENPKLNLQLAAIKQLMQKLQKHEHFPIFQQGNTTPTIKCLLKILRAKIQKNYKVHQFEADLLRIFKVYYKTSKEKVAVVRNIKNYQKFMKNAIEKQKIIFTNSENQPVKIQQSELKLAQNRDTKNKLTKKPARNKIQEPEGHETKDIQKLGKNVCRLNQNNIEQFCVQFCGQDNEKQQGETCIFQFDFNKENTAKLIEMQQFVKQKLVEQKVDFVEVSDDDVSEQFIIENDD